MDPIGIRPGKCWTSQGDEHFHISDLHSGVALAGYDSIYKRGLAWIRSGDRREDGQICNRDKDLAEIDLETFLGQFYDSGPGYPKLFGIATPYQNGRNPMFDHVYGLLQAREIPLVGSDLTESLEVRPIISHLDVVYKHDEIVVVYKSHEGRQIDLKAVKRIPFPKPNS